MYKVEFTESAVKQLKKLDKQTVRVIKNWVIKNLVNTPDPRLHGKALKGNLKRLQSNCDNSRALSRSLQATVK